VSQQKEQEHGFGHGNRVLELNRGRREEALKCGRAIENLRLTAHQALRCYHCGAMEKLQIVVGHPKNLPKTKLGEITDIIVLAGFLGEALLVERLPYVQEFGWIEIDGRVVSVAAILQPPDNYLAALSKTSGRNLLKDEWAGELSLVATDSHYRSKGFATAICEALIKRADGNVFSVCRVNNRSMNSILNRCDFKTIGPSLRPDEQADSQLQVLGRPSLKKRIQLLRETKEHHTQIAMEMFVGNFFPMDLLAAATLNRSLCLIRGFADLMTSKNFVAAAPLIRMQIDNCLRFSAAWLVDNPHHFATEIIKGKQVRKMKDNKGKLMTDTYLLSVLTADYPWLTSVYENTSGYIHLSDKHFFNCVTDVGEQRQLDIKISWRFRRSRTVIRRQVEQDSGVKPNSNRSEATLVF
jgi:GNAT superfamily N-acetyltransferase